MQILNLGVGMSLVVVGGLIILVDSLMLGSSVCICLLMRWVRQIAFVYIALINLTQPLTYLGSLVVEHVPSKQYVVGLSPT